MTKTKPPGPDLAGAVAAMRKAPARGYGRRGAVYRWLAARHDAFAAAIENEPPSWKALATFLGENGVMQPDGLPPTAASVRSTWLRVHENALRRKARTQSSPSEMQRKPIEAGREPVADDDDPPGTEPLPTTFAPVRRKD